MKKVLMIIGLVGIATLAQANNFGGEEKKNVEARATLAEVAEQMGIEEADLQTFFGMETQSVKIFDANDQLVAEGDLNAFGEAKDDKVAALLLNSERLMNFGNTQYYRLK